jgi:hypothetical protein
LLLVLLDLEQPPDQHHRLSDLHLAAQVQQHPL